MSDWREKIIKQISTQSSHFIIVQDKEKILTEEEIMNDLIENRYYVIRYENSVEFRYIYEQKVRGKENISNVLVIVYEDISLPYEYEKEAISIKLDMQSIFPKFSSKIMSKMGRETFDDLYTLHQSYRGNDSEYETLNFIVKNYYKIPYDIINTEIELYKSLLSIHHEIGDLPEVISNFLYKKWVKNYLFSDLPLKELIRYSSAFYKYVEKEWEKLVLSLFNSNVDTIEDPNQVKLKNPLRDKELRWQVNELFLEGKLNKVTGVNVAKIPEWMHFGIDKANLNEDVHVKIDYLKKEIENLLMNAERYSDWLKIIYLLAEYHYYSLINDKSYDDIFTEVNNRFQLWILEKYHSLTSMPPYPRAQMSHHVPHVINHNKKADEKIALIVLDGMSYGQWVYIKNKLQSSKLSFEDYGIFSWVPTLTSVSRQSIFSGKIPLKFAKSITTTNLEEKKWKAFWEEQGILSQYVSYQRGLGTEKYNKSNLNGLKRKQTKVYGLVIDAIDQFSHNATLGEKSVMSDLNIWLDEGYLKETLNDLHEEGFTVYITSDHGNTSAVGIGRVSEGVLVDQKGERVRIYSDDTLYSSSAKKIPALQWSNVGLPDDYYVLLSKYNEAFVPKNKRVITHGGISIEEVIVPFIKVNFSSTEGSDQK